VEGFVFIGHADTDDALKRIEKKQKMRRTGQNPRRTGQRGGNGGEINRGGHGVENEVLNKVETRERVLDQMGFLNHQ
jgi:hypothetical protein